MITKDPKQIEILRQGGRILATVLNLVAQKATPGVSAQELDLLAESEIRKAGGIPAFKNYRSSRDASPFPASLCVSINHEVVHGIPGKDKVLKSGDIVGLDLGVKYKNLFTDAAISVAVGTVDQQSKKLIQATKEALDSAISVAVPGKTTGDIGAAIESVAKKYGFSPVRELVGHGVGLSVHEDPEIPCFGKPGSGTPLVEGMVVAIEPMLNIGGWRVAFAPDGWTVQTADGSRSAHMEHTLVITADGCEVLTQI